MTNNPPSIMLRLSSILAAAMFVFPLFATAVQADKQTGMQAESHRATYLGNPATRFAPPVKTPDALRRTLQSKAIRSDVEWVARKSGYQGDMADFWRAVQSEPIKALSIPHNTLLPAMSTRKKGKADVLFNVLWVGKQPIDAYEFSFISGERRYRVVTPKACSNFWIEEQQPPPKAELVLSCTSPAEAGEGASVEACCTLTNVGELAEPNAILTMTLPAGTKACCASGDGLDISETSRMTWKLGSLAPGAKRTVCTRYPTLPTGSVTFSASVTAQRAAGISASTETRVRAAK